MLPSCFNRHTLRTSPIQDALGPDGGAVPGQGEGAGAPSSAQKSGTSGTAPGPGMELDVPVFLRTHAEMILTTGEAGTVAM